MKLVNLLIIILAILVAYYLMCHMREKFTPGDYVLSWTSPTDNGGDPTCCSYDWQICSDEKCTNIVDSGTVSKTNASTTKLDWDTTYTVMVRAVNKFGKSGWATASLSTSPYSVGKVVMAQSLDASGGILTPFEPGKNTISVYAELNIGDDQSPIASYNCRAYLTVNRNGTVVYSSNFALAYNGGTKIQSPLGFMGFPEGNPAVDMEMNDVVSVDVLFGNAKNQQYTESVASTTVSGGPANSPTGLTLAYIPLGNRPSQ